MSKVSALSTFWSVGNVARWIDSAHSGYSFETHMAPVNSSSVDGIDIPCMFHSLHISNIASPWLWLKYHTMNPFTGCILFWKHWLSSYVPVVLSQQIVIAFFRSILNNHRKMNRTYQWRPWGNELVQLPCSLSHRSPAALAHMGEHFPFS